MSKLFYLIRFPVASSVFYRLPSNHGFPSPMNTGFNVWYGEHKVGERGDKLFVPTVKDYYDDLQNGNLYMMLADDGGDAWNNESEDAEQIIQALLEQGWESRFKFDY